MSIQAEIALLTSVPLEHLESGLPICEREGRVAFGSDDGMKMAEIDAASKSADLPVLIYASKAGGPPQVTWMARWSRLTTPAERNSHLRPPSTRTDSNWLIYYEVTDLRRLAADEVIPISSLRRPAGGKLSATFIPHGPIAIQNPI